MTPNADNDNTERPRSYDELVQKYERLIKRIAKQYGRSYDTEEFEQDIYVDLYRRWAQYNPAYSFGTWICLCSKNVAMSRKQRKNSLMRKGVHVDINDVETLSYPCGQEQAVELAEVLRAVSGDRKTDILFRVAAGEELIRIGEEYGIGKERVRQLVEKERALIRKRLGLRPGEAA